jgi:hypothetical protein
MNFGEKDTLNYCDAKEPARLCGFANSRAGARDAVDSGQVSDSY